MDFKNRKVIITGGSMGIGLQLANKLLDEGAQVLVCSRNQADLDKIKKNYPMLEVTKCDVTIKSDVEKLLEQSKQILGGVDILFNNAAIFKRFNILEDSYPIEKQFQEIDINLNGLIQTTNVFLPELLKAKNGIIVNLTSPAAFVPMAASPIYSATKAAVSSYTTSLRFQLRDTNLRVVLLCPTAIDTRMNKNNPGVETMNLMSTEKFVNLALKGLKKNKDEIYVKPIGMFKKMSQISPSMAFRFINKNKK